MKAFVLDGLELEPFRAEAPGAENAQRRWSSREGLILSVRAGPELGRGEVSPLPGYSPDTLDEARRELAGLRLEGARVEARLEGAAELASPLSSPSARFALEHALLELAARARGAPLHELLGPFVAGPRSVAEVSTFALEDRGAELEAQMEAELRRHAVGGAAAVKLKVGRPGAWERERAAIASAAELASGLGLALRVDANRGFGEAAAERLRELSEHAIELAEEPGPPEAWLEAAGPMPALALDESLREPGAAVLLERAAPRLGAVVLKPAVLGGLAASLAWAEQAMGLGVPAIVSHLFDGEVAAAAYRALALALPPGGPAHGLGLARAGGRRIAPESGRAQRGPS